MALFNDSAAALLTLNRMADRHKSLRDATEYKPGYEGILLAAEELVIEKWLDEYHRITQGAEREATDDDN